MIKEAKTKEDWINASKTKTPAWCYYKNLTDAPKFYASGGQFYGKLYNWYALIGDTIRVPRYYWVNSSDPNVDNNKLRKIIRSEIMKGKKDVRVDNMEDKQNGE